MNNTDFIVSFVLYYTMVSVLSCFGCQFLKKKKTDKFFDVSNMGLGLTDINFLRTGSNSRKRMLQALDELPPASKICRLCYDQASRNQNMSNAAVEEPNEQNSEPHLSFYRKGHNSHKYCTFGSNIRIT